MYHKRNIEARSRNRCRLGKAIIIITYSQCVSVALAIQHAMRMRRSILSTVACQALPYFSTSSYKRYDFRGWGRGELLNILICFNFLYNFPPKDLILRKIQPDVIIHVHTSSCKVLLMLVRF